MVEAFSRMKKFAEQREEADIKIISWWVMVLVVMMAAVLAFFSYQLGLFTLIAFTSYIVYKRVERRDKHFSRIDSFIESAIDCTQEYAQDFEGDVSEELDDMRRRLQNAREAFLIPKGAKKWGVIFVVISFVSLIEHWLVALGVLVITLYILHFLSTDWYRLQKFEQEMIDLMCRTWATLGLLESPFQVEITASKKHFVTNVLLSFLTLGVWGIVWDYKIHNDAVSVVRESKRWEERVLDVFEGVASAMNEI